MSLFWWVLQTVLLSCSQAPAPEDPHQQAVEQLQAFPDGASEFTEPRLRSLELVRHEDRDAVLPLLGLRPGLVVGDIGCGIGHFTLPIAQALGPQGRVYAVDIEPRYLEIVAQRAASRAGAAPVTTVLDSESDVGLPAAALDLAFLSQLDFYLVRPLEPAHHRALLLSVRRAVKPGGRVLVLQWMGAREGGSPEKLRANFEDAGFQHLHSHEFAQFDSWLLEFVKPAG